MIKNNKAVISWILIAIIAAVAVGVAAPLLTKTPDSPAEQAAEQFIKAETGQDIDFSYALKHKQNDGKPVSVIIPQED